MTDNEILYFASSKISGIQLKIFASHKGIVKIFLNKSDSIESSNQTNLRPDDPFLFNVFQQLDEYFCNKRKTFNVPLDIHGTEFQKKVWNELSKIPYGKTVSYKTIAERVGDLKSIRSVGKANGANPIPIIIPCHRVINSDGSIGGYSGGIKIKEKLLELEGIIEPRLFN
jgi:methylated-DNA-[protein]-cysteine S-methyltransferase